MYKKKTYHVVSPVFACCQNLFPVASSTKATVYPWYTGMVHVDSVRDAICVRERERERKRE